MTTPVDQVEEMPYRIELWDDHDTRIDETIALVADHAVARAALAVKRRPGKVVILLQKSRVWRKLRAIRPPSLNL